MKKAIRLFAMDVDGTMTDGRIYMGDHGEVMKSFDIKDGYGIHELLRSNGIKTAIITGRKSKIVENRAAELEIDFVLQGVKNKKEALIKLASEIGVKLEDILFMGDDCMDICAMEVCGLAACPADAVEDVKKICDYICDKNAGKGAVRECIEWVLE